MSDDLLNEYFDVLSRTKFARYHDFKSQSELILTKIEKIAKKYIPIITIDIIDDYDDNKLLELADESDADFLITGNINDFTMKTYKNTKIVSPKEYWEYYRKK